MDKSGAGHGNGSMHIYSGSNIHSWRCGRHTHITFCDGSGPRWVEGLGYHCDRGGASTSAGRVDNELTHYWSHDDDWWRSAAVQAYDHKKHGGPVKFSDAKDDGTCFGGTRLLAAREDNTEFNDLSTYWHGIQVPYGYSASVFKDKAW